MATQTSTATTSVETVTSPADKAKLALAAALVVAAIGAFYWLSPENTWTRVAALVVLLAAAIGVFFASEPGRQLVAFGRDSWREVQKVVWPTRKESLQMTMYVFAFVIVMAVFLWIVDKALELTLYELLLGWRK